MRLLGAEGRENGELLFNGYRVSVLQDENSPGAGWYLLHPISSMASRRVPWGTGHWVSCIHPEYEEERHLGPKVHRHGHCRSWERRGKSDPLEGLPALNWDQGKTVLLESSDSQKV